MEVLRPLIDMIKTNENEEKLVKEIIEILKVFLLNKNLSKDPQELIKLIKKLGKNLKNECPTAFPIFNILTRMITLIKKKMIKLETKSPENTKPQLKRHSSLINIDKKASSLLELVKDLKELEASKEECCTFANYHINEGETILISAKTDYLDSFIQNTFEEINYALIIVLKNSQKKPQILEKYKDTDVLFVSENSIFSIMSRVNKVFMDCQCIMSDGAVINDAGSFNIAIVAKEFAVPLFILSPRFKFTPLYAFAQDTFNKFMKPQEFFIEAEGVEGLEVVINKFNLVPSEYVSIIITDDGEYSTNYVYRVFSEYYSDVDYGYHFD